MTRSAKEWLSRWWDFKGGRRSGAERAPNAAGLRRCNARTREGSLCLKSANRRLGFCARHAA